MLRCPDVAQLSNHGGVGRIGDVMLTVFTFGNNLFQLLDLPGFAPNLSHVGSF
jgi:hypothetical protein